MTTERHPADDLLLDLALGQVGAVERDRLAQHLGVCPTCRQEVDDLAVGVERLLPAVPRIGPPTGFEDRVTARLRTEGRGGRTARPAAIPRRTLLAAAAAAVLGVVAGAGATLALVERPEPPLAAGSTWTRLLRDAAGTTVGTVSPSHGEQGAVLVVDVADDAAVGEVECRLALADGTTRTVATWDVVAGRPNSWVVAVPDAEVVTVQLVDGSGQVWSRAEL